MEYINAFLVILSGLFLRLVLPITVTVMLIAVLKRLDERWQLEAQQLPAISVEKTRCWEIKHCTPEQRAACVAFNSEKPCWQERRLANGYLPEECLDCDVFEQAPLPTQAVHI